MKYIRTKDGIYELEHIYMDGIIFHGSVEYDREGNVIYDIDDKTTFITQADTIKELCDELIIKNPNNDGDFNKKVFVTTNRWEILLNEKHAKHCINRDIYEYDVEIFGAIWTYDSDGVPTLKAVAKMNDKGELELL